MDLYTERRRFMLGEFRRLGFEVYGGHGGYIALLDTASGPGHLKPSDFCLRLLQCTGLQVALLLPHTIHAMMMAAGQQVFG